MQSVERSAAQNPPIQEISRGEGAVALLCQTLNIPVRDRKFAEKFNTTGRAIYVPYNPDGADVTVILQNQELANNLVFMIEKIFKSDRLTKFNDKEIAVLTRCYAQLEAKSVSIAEQARDYKVSGAYVAHIMTSALAKMRKLTKNSEGNYSLKPWQDLLNSSKLLK